MGTKLRRSMVGFALFSVAGLGASTAHASMQTVVGHVTSIQGHLNPNWRTVSVREDSTCTIWYFRLALPRPGPDTIGAAILAALATGQQVGVVFDPAVTTGCGVEPAIQYVTIASS